MKNNWKEERLIYAVWLHFIIGLIFIAICILAMIPFYIFLLPGDPEQNSIWYIPTAIIGFLGGAIMLCTILWSIIDFTWQMFLCDYGLWPKPKRLRTGGGFHSGFDMGQ